MDYIDISGWERLREPQEKAPGVPVRQPVKRSAARRRKRRRRLLLARMMFGGVVLLAGVLLGVIFWRLLVMVTQHGSAENSAVIRELTEAGKETESNDSAKPLIVEDFLTINPYSRPGEALPEVRNIFVHYTANPGTTAEQNRSYFENLGITGETSASAHFVIGFDGTIIQCIPLDEIGYAVKTRNYDSISIECCYQSEDGRFTEETYDSLIRLTGWLLKKYGLSSEDVLRHYDEGGKKCPLYFVENEGAWEQFRQDLRSISTRSERLTAAGKGGRPWRCVPSGRTVRL